MHYSKKYRGIVIKKTKINKRNGCLGLHQDYIKTLIQISYQEIWMRAQQKCPYPMRYEKGAEVKDISLRLCGAKR